MYISPDGIRRGQVKVHAGKIHWLRFPEMIQELPVDYLDATVPVIAEIRIVIPGSFREEPLLPCLVMSPACKYTLLVK